MKNGYLVIILLSVALVVSNIWWVVRLTDAELSSNYIKVSLHNNEQALNQTLSIIPVLAKPGTTRAEILSAARMGIDSTDVFEKDGYTWIGQIGLKFNAQDELQEVVRNWSSE